MPNNTHEAISSENSRKRRKEMTISNKTEERKSIQRNLKEIFKFPPKKKKKMIRYATDRVTHLEWRTATCWGSAWSQESSARQTEQSLSKGGAS